MRRLFHQKRCINAASLAHRKRRSQNQQDVWSVVELIANSFASHFEDPVVIECEVRFGIVLCIFIILRLTRRFACFKMQCSVPHHIVTVFCGERKPARVGCPVSGLERWHFRKKRHVRQRQDSIAPPAGTHRIRESRQLFGMDRRQIQSDFSRTSLSAAASALSSVLKYVSGIAHAPFSGSFARLTSSMLT